MAKLSKRVKVQRVIELLEQDDTILNACRLVGIANQDFYKFLKRPGSADLAERHQAVADTRRANMRRHLYRRAQAAQDSDKVLKWLERRDPEFKPKSAVEVKDSRTQLAEALALTATEIEAELANLQHATCSRCQDGHRPNPINIRDELARLAKTRISNLKLQTALVELVDHARCRRCQPLASRRAV